MSAQFTVDLSSSNEHITHAIQHAAYESSNSTKIGLDIRNQVLANARTPWPLPMLDGSGQSWSMPNMEVLIYRACPTDTTVQARVVYHYGPADPGAFMAKEKYVFLETDPKGPAQGSRPRGD